MSILANIQHANIVTLLGVCVEGDHRLAVFELCPGGSLRGALNAGRRQKGLLAASQSQHEHINKPPFGHSTVLEWPERLQIAHGAACGLAFLHEVQLLPTSLLIIFRHCMSRIFSLLQCLWCSLWHHELKIS